MTSFEHAPVREGDVLANKYKVERVLGVGGMGIVVAARHIDLEQRVALKFLLPEAMASEEMVGRFLNEGRAAVRLKSEHVAKVLDVGRLDNGAPYIVMEYLEGHDLGAEIRENKGVLSIEDATGYVLQACEAVAEAHAAKIIHRDLKPQNLFLTRGLDGESLVKVLDFGISKTIAPPKGTPGSDGLTLTRTQSMLGSPLYMSPEQMRSSKNVDARSDIWSFGVILFELLTGRVPFEAENMPELVFKIAEGDAPNAKALRDDIPEALATIISRCLQKDVEKRFANIGELAMALEPFASERERGLGLRATLVLGGSLPRARTASIPDSPIQAPPAGPISAVASTNPASASNPSSSAALASTGATSDAWSGTRAGPAILPKRPRRPMTTYVIAGIAAFVVASGAVTFSRLHGHSSDTDVAATPSPPPMALTAVSPTITTSAQTSLQASPASSTAAIATATATAIPSQTSPDPVNSAGSAIAPKTASTARNATKAGANAPSVASMKSNSAASNSGGAAKTAPSATATSTAGASGFIQVRE